MLGRRSLLILPGLLFLGMSAWLLLAMFSGERPRAVLGYTPLPDFSLPALQDPERLLSAVDLRGAPLLLNVWGSWCLPCRQEHPFLLRLAARGEVALAGLNYLDAPADAQEFLDELGDPYRLVISDREGDFGRALGVQGAPETFLLDAQGAVRYRHVGLLDERVWNDTFRPLLAQLAE